MSASATPLTCAAERVPRWSSTGLARARPERWPALLGALHSSQRSNVMATRVDPVGASSKCKHSTAAASRLTPTSIAAVKSP
jgi:hypothetical protein